MAFLKYRKFEFFSHCRIVRNSVKLLFSFPPSKHLLYFCTFVEAVEQYPQKYIEYDGILTNGGMKLDVCMRAEFLKNPWFFSFLECQWSNEEEQDVEIWQFGFSNFKVPWKFHEISCAFHLGWGKIIADRAYNMRSYIRGTGGGPRALESVEWDPKSPNLSSVPWW